MLLIRRAKIVCPGSSLHGKKRDILIDKGIIRKISASIKNDKAKVIESPNLHVSIGWFDPSVMVGDPGYEHREDLESVTNTAAAGGFTGIACLPNTFPVMDSKSGILYIKRNSSNLPVELFPLGAITAACDGKELTEIYDMQVAGAVGFTDGLKSIQHNGILLRALQYVKPFNGVIVNLPSDQSLNQNGLMNEGEVSTGMGVRGIPHVAEETMVHRDLYLLDYTESRLHLSKLSSRRSVEMVRQAKKRGSKVTASVPVMNLIFDDSKVKSFDPMYKVIPPLRTITDRRSLIQGVKDGTIDSITSNHIPLDEESKNLEFAYSEFGVIGLQTAFSLLMTHLQDKLDLDLVIDILSRKNREIYNLHVPVIKEGELANLTLFDPECDWVFEKQNILSKSRNSPFIGSPFKGKVLGIIRGKSDRILN